MYDLQFSVSCLKVHTAECEGNLPPAITYCLKTEAKTHWQWNILGCISYTINNAKHHYYDSLIWSQQQDKYVPGVFIYY